MVTAHLLVNGQSQPVIAMRPGTWYRWRMAYSSIDRLITGTSLNGCEMQLLAKDGVYLPTAPRAISVRSPSRLAQRPDFLHLR